MIGIQSHFDYDDLGRMNDYEFLQSRFAPLWASAAAAKAIFPGLVAAYSEPHRHYHTLQHLRECLSDLDDAACVNQADVALALFFHDFVYNVQDSRFNEIESAHHFQQLAWKYGLAWPWPRSIAHILGYITSTKHDCSSQWSTNDCDVVLDIDLGILGKPADRFDEYESQIRAEYAHVPDDVFRPVRAKILSKFLQATSIYKTKVFQERYEVTARTNLARSISQLTK